MNSTEMRRNSAPRFVPRPASILQRGKNNDVDFLVTKKRGEKLPDDNWLGNAKTELFFQFRIEGDFLSIHFDNFVGAFQQQKVPRGQLLELGRLFINELAKLGRNDHGGDSQVGFHLQQLEENGARNKKFPTALSIL